MINGKPIDIVNPLTMLHDIQRMTELGELKNWEIIYKYDLISEFVNFGGVIPAPYNTIASTTPIKSWQTNSKYQWYARIRDEKTGEIWFFTALSD